MVLLCRDKALIISFTNSILIVHFNVSFFVVCPTNVWLIILDFDWQLFINLPSTEVSVSFSIAMFSSYFLLCT